MQRINEDIKNGNFKQIYLLYGEERYLKTSTRPVCARLCVRRGTR